MATRILRFFVVHIGPNEMPDLASQGQRLLLTAELVPLKELGIIEIPEPSPPKNVA